MELEYIIKENNTDKSINELLSLEFNLSNRLTTKLIKNEKILLNDIPCDTRIFPKYNDVLTIDFNMEEDNSNIVPTKMNLNIIYEDEWFLVVNKPAGIPIHPSRMHFVDSLSNGVKYYFDLIGLKKKIRPVNRLDLDTSGLVLFAKCEYIQEALIQQMSKNIFKKVYLCLINGFLENESGIINLPIARKSGSIIERCINQEGHPSITHYKLIRKYTNYSLIECKLETGRTHQIRVHMSAIGHPLLGDTLYGNGSDLINRQALHSYQIECIHPIFKKTICFKSELPQDMNNLL